MRNFRFVVWWVDQWDSRFDHMGEWSCQADSRDEAVRMFSEENGERHSVQCVFEENT